MQISFWHFHNELVVLWVLLTALLKINFSVINSFGYERLWRNLQIFLNHINFTSRKYFFSCNNCYQSSLQLLCDWKLDQDFSLFKLKITIESIKKVSLSHICQLDWIFLLNKLAASNHSRLQIKQKVTECLPSHWVYNSKLPFHANPLEVCDKTDLNR